MKIEGVIKYFGNKRQTGIRLGVSRKTVYNWLKKGEVPKKYHRRVLEAMGLA